jgi:hypothetical protein
MLCHRGQLFNLDGLRCDGPVDGECRRCVHPSAAVGGAAYRSARVLRALPGSSIVLRAASKVLNQVANQVAAPDETVLTKVRFAHMRDRVETDVILAPSATIADRFAACGMPPGISIVGTRDSIRLPPRVPRAAGTPPSRFRRVLHPDEGAAPAHRSRSKTSARLRERRSCGRDSQLPRRRLVSTAAGADAR